MYHILIWYFYTLKNDDCQGGSDGKESACNAGNLGSILGSGRSQGGGDDNPFQYSCLENPMDRGSWQATVHGVAKSWTRLGNFHFTSNIVTICHIHSCYSIINYIPCTECCILVTYHRNFIPLNPFHLFNLPPDSSAFWKPPVYSLSMNLFWFYLFIWFVF